MIGITADKTWDAGSIMDLLTVARKLYLESVESYRCPFLHYRGNTSTCMRQYTYHTLEPYDINHIASGNEVMLGLTAK